MTVVYREKHFEFTILRMAAYCRVSSNLDTQFGSLQAQKEHFTTLINNNRLWELAGIYADNASGRCNKRMHQFQKMMTACRNKEIDLILVKSVSRLERNTLEILQTCNELRELGIEIFFEIEKLHIQDPKEIQMLTIFSSIAQDESESKRYNIHWSFRRGFEDGTSKLYNRPCYGYECSKNGILTIDAEKAEIVRQIFQWRTDGISLRKISKRLKERGIKSPRGKDIWHTETLSKLLSNEKYTGNVMLQKTFVNNYFTGKQVKNEGQLEHYFAENNHPPIISKELFVAVGNVVEECL